MAIYRGTGGSGDSTQDTTLNAVTEQATNANSSASAAATSATSASTSASTATTQATAASTSATNAATSATNAATSETNAATSETNAATSETNAATSETNAATSATNASTSETNAATSETNASNSATSASTSATTATTQATTATTQANTATTKAAEALASQTAAATSATAAATSATAAQTAETAAETAETNAETAQTAAEAAETAAEAAETAATASETAAAASQASATASANSATASANSAASSATDAQSSEDDAATSEVNAANSASAASSSASAASSSATNAATSATNAATSATSAAASLASFTGQYVSQATAPSSPTTGDLWFDETADIMKVYNGSGWVNAGSSVNGVENSVEYTATANQTTFSATYDAGYVEVYLNGIRLDRSDYTATNGTSIVLDVGAAVGDSVFIHAFGTFALADHYNKVDSDARYVQIDSSGNVGIGTSSPATKLDVEYGSGNTYPSAAVVGPIFSDKTASENFGLNIFSDNASNASINFGDEQLANAGRIVYDHNGNANTMAFHTSASERMRIDSSGNVLVGKTIANQLGTVGTELQADGQLYVTSNAQDTVRLNRLASDGTLIDFRKDSSVVGSIGSYSNYLQVASQNGVLNLGLSSATTYYQMVDSTGSGNPRIQASTDAVADLGTSGNRFADLHLSGTANVGGLQLSDASESGKDIVFKITNDNIGGDAYAGGIYWKDTAGSQSTKGASIQSYMPTANVGDLRFFTSQGATRSEKMRIDSSGNVGIGTSSPTEKLDVTGTVKATAFEGDGSSLTGIEGVPSGIIAMWSGSDASIPSGWNLCNGSNGTPDLRDRFIVGSGSSYSTGNTGGASSVTPSGSVNVSGLSAGSTTLSTSQIPSHNHYQSKRNQVYPSYTHSGQGATSQSGINGYSSGSTPTQNTGGSGSHNHSISGSASFSGSSAENRPPYYALAYIMKS